MSLQANVVASLPHVEADMNYLAPMADRPRNYTFEPPAGVPRSNTNHEAHKVAIHDARPVAGAVSLDANGFALVNHRSAVRDFFDDEEVRRVYYPEVERVLKQVTGAYRVHIFDHTMRRRVDGAQDRSDAPRQPVQRVHIDHTARSGPQRVRDLLPDEADELLKGRVQVINLWRPIKGPLQDSPLAVCDATTIRADDLVPSDLVYPHRVGETYSVRYNPAHQWFYVPRMQPDEALLLKCSDISDQRAGPLHAAQRLHRSDHAGRCAAAREHRGADAGVPPLRRSQHRQFVTAADVADDLAEVRLRLEQGAPIGDQSAQHRAVALQQRRRRTRPCACWASRACAARAASGTPLPRWPGACWHIRIAAAAVEREMPAWQCTSTWLPGLGVHALAELQHLLDVRGRAGLEAGILGHDVVEADQLVVDARDSRRARAAAARGCR